MNLKPFNVKFPIPQGFNEEECYPFDVECLRSDSWEENPEVLFIIGFVDSGDIKNGQLLTSSPAKDVFQIILDGSLDYYKRVTGKKARLPNMAVINFNYHKNMHLKGVQLEVSMSKSAKRCHKLIQKLKPKKVVCFGKEAAGWILGDISQGIHFGMPKELKLKDHECIVIPAPSYHNTIMRLDEDASDEDYDEAITNANMVGYMSRAVSTMYTGEMLITADVQPNYEELTTYKQVDDYLTMLEERDKPFSLDIETNSLFNYDVHLSTIQFATSHKLGTLIVLEHEDSPFSDKDKKRIYKRLRELFSIKEPNTYIIGQNLSYDFRILRHILGLSVIHWSAWDTMGGEHALDENLRDMNTRLPGERSSRNYALDKICLRYGIGWYASSEFGKSQRHLIHEISLDDSVRGYMSMDVQATMAIHHLQHKRAMAMSHEGGNYLETFHNYVLNVLGQCTTHTISTMEHRGIQLSRKMFTELQGPNSTLTAKINEITRTFYELPTVKEANRELLTERGAPMQGLWGTIEESVFNIGKEAHVQKLFLDILGIEDYEERKDGRGAKVGKAFQGKYKEAHKEVELYGEYKKHKAIMSTYIKGWQKKISKDFDSMTDFRIRPSYSYLLVTGRSNSFNPNLQNVPEHHSSAKYVKLTMRAPLGYLKMDADYSSHEVRVWALASKDPNLITTFRTSLEYIYALRKNQDVKSYLQFKYESDTHKINYSGFTGVPVKEVTKEQRQSAKGIVFGCFTSDTIVSTDSGPIRLGTLCTSKHTPKVISASGALRQSGGAKSRGVKPVHQVLTRMALLKGTPDHKVQIVTEDCKLKMVAIKNLKAGDSVVMQQGLFGTTLPESEGVRFTPKDVEAMGLFTADGSANIYDGYVYRVHHCSIDKLEVEKVQSLFKKLGGVKAPITKVLATDFAGCVPSIDGNKYVYNCYLNNKQAYYRLESIGLLGSQHVRRVPNIVLSSPKKYVASYLRGYFEGDGGFRISGKRVQISATSVNSDLIYDISYLLSLFDIKHGVYATSTAYELVISHSEAILKYIKEIGFITDKKVGLCEEACKLLSTNRGIPVQGIDTKIDLAAIKETYRKKAGVKTFRSKTIYTEKGTIVPPINRTLLQLIHNIEEYRDALLEFGMTDVYETLKTLSTCRVSKVYENLGYTHDEEVFDVVNVDTENKWTANGVVVSNSMYGIGDGSLAKSINKSLDETREIKGKFFKRYAKGAKWMTDQCDSTIKHKYIVSMLGRRRNLDGHQIPVPTLRAAFERRAQNSPIQGMASDLGYIGARLYTLAIAQYCEDFDIVSNKQYMIEHGWEEHLTEFDRTKAFAPAGIDSMVHDSIKSQVRYDMMLVAIHLKEWAMTTGVRKYVKEKLGVKFHVDLGVEFDVGASGATMETWNWVSKDLVIKEKKSETETDEYTILGLPSLIRNALKEQLDYGYDIDVNSLMKEMISSYKDAREYLEENFPLPYMRYRDHGVVN